MVERVLLRPPAPHQVVERAPLRVVQVRLELGRRRGRAAAAAESEEATPMIKPLN